MRQASRGDKMTNNRPGGSCGGAPGTGIGEAGDPAPTVAASHVPAIAFNHNAQAAQLPSANRDTTINDGLTCSQQAAVAIGFQDDTTPKASIERIGAIRADAGGEGACVQHCMSVRRLTPTECERLQGFPDGYTNIPWRKKPTSPDGPRYKALGNSMAVPCMAWIGKRIALIHAQSESLNLDV